MRLVALVLLLCLPACVKATRPLEAPRAELRDVSPTAGGFSVELSVFNPNDTALELRAIDWELSADGRPIARGRDEQVVNVAARATTAITTTIRASRPGELTGTLHFFAGSRGITAAFSSAALLVHGDEAGVGAGR